MVKFSSQSLPTAIGIGEGSASIAAEELNSGTIYFSSTDHLGNFRVGEQFFVDLETGNSTLTIDESTVDSFAGLTVTTNGNVAIIDGTKVQNQNIRLNLLLKRLE